MVHLLLVLISVSVSLACISDADCQYNGVCTRTRHCQCGQGWMGTNCGMLDLAPAAPNNGFRQMAENGSWTSSWGGSIHRSNATGAHYLLASEITNSCGVKEYMTNSQGALAVSVDGAAGPYTRIRTVIPVVAHNLQTLMLPDGSLVTFILGDGHSLVPQKDCRSKPAASPLQSVLLPLKPKCGEHNWTGGACTANITVYHAQSIASEFRAITVQVHLLDGAFIINFNPSPYIFPDGRAALLFNAKGSTCCLCDQWTPCLAFATAPSWRGPFTMVQPRIWPDRASGMACEDPYLWADQAEVFHLLCHHNEPQLVDGPYTGPAGIHAYSADGGHTWSKPVAAYGTKAKLTNGTTLSFVRRERPWLLFDGSGSDPSHLLTGTSLNSGEGFSWTFIQPINTRNTRLNHHSDQQSG